jgi:hypothetical protein
VTLVDLMMTFRDGAIFLYILPLGATHNLGGPRLFFARNRTAVDDIEDVLLSSLAQPHLEPPQQNADVDVHSRPVTSVVALSRRRHSISRAARGDATLLAIAL